MEAQGERNITSRHLATLKHKLSKYLTRIRELERDKEETGLALRQLQFEFNSLYQMTTRQMEETEMKRQIIANKEMKITELKGSLKEIEVELKEAHHQIPLLQKSLEKMEEELESKTKEVEEMRGNVNDMTLLLHMNHRVLGDYLMQEAAAKISSDRYMQELQVSN